MEEALLPLIVFGLPILGSIYVLIQLLKKYIREYKTGTYIKSDLHPKIKIGFIIFGIIYGCSPVILLFFDRFKSDVSFFIFQIVIVLYIPYMAIVYGIGYAFGIGSGRSGISSKLMYDTLEINKKNKRKSS